MLAIELLACVILAVIAAWAVKMLAIMVYATTRALLLVIVWPFRLAFRLCWWIVRTVARVVAFAALCIWRRANRGTAAVPRIKLVVDNTVRN